MIRMMIITVKTFILVVDSNCKCNGDNNGTNYKNAIMISLVTNE